MSSSDRSIAYTTLDHQARSIASTALPSSHGRWSKVLGAGVTDWQTRIQDSKSARLVVGTLSFQGSPAMLALPEAMAGAMFVAGSDAVRAAEQSHCMRPACRLLVPACLAWSVLAVMGVWLECTYHSHRMPPGFSSQC